MIRKHKTFYLIFLLTVFFSCGLPYRKLDSGNGNSVPKKGYVWMNESKFDSDIYKQLNSSFFYELADEYWSDKNFIKTRSIQYGTLWKKKLQFYPNGKLRRFASKFADPNPEITGNRGIIYKDNNQIKIDFFERTPGNSPEINTYTVKIEGDYIYMFKSTIVKEKLCEVFKKSDSLSDDYNKYPAIW